MTASPLAIAAIAAGTVIGAFGALNIKLGARSFRLSFGQLRNRRLILGGTLYIISLVPYLYALRSLPLAVAYPLTSMTYIWSALLAKKYLNERIGAWRWGGIGAIIIGIALLAQ